MRPGSPSRKAQALLAYLALRPGEALCREKLMDLLWSDRGETQARTSLRQALTALRKGLAAVQPLPLVVNDDKVAAAAG